MTEGAEGGSVGRLDNGLTATSFVALTDTDATVGPTLLMALGRARIAAYLTAVPPGELSVLDDDVEDGAPLRLYVARSERIDARTVVAAALRALGTATDDAATDERGAPDQPSDDERDDEQRGDDQRGDHPTEDPDDPLAGIDTDKAFAELVAGWHVDTVAAVREAEKQLSREDEDWRARLRPAADESVWLDDDHYIPPPPPPLPRFAAPTIGAMVIIAVSILLLGIGGQFGLASDLTLLLGIGGLLLGAGILMSRLRADREDDEDDGSVV